MGMRILCLHWAKCCNRLQPEFVFFHLDHECKISYDILDVHLSCNIDSIGTNGEKIRKNRIRIQRE